MSMPDIFGGSVSLDPKGMKLIERITSKTREGKIVWEKTSSGLVANIPGFLLAFGHLPASLAALLGEAMPWDEFAVRGRQRGEKILAVTNLPPTSVPAIAKAQIAAVDELYNLANKSDSANKTDSLGLDKALDAIDSL